LRGEKFLFKNKGLGPNHANQVALALRADMARTCEYVR
jgi:hypothetical protein